MTGRELLRIVIALVVVLFLWGVAAMLGGGGDDVPEGEILPALAPHAVDTVEIARPADTVLLVQGGDGRWTVNGYATDPQGITTLLEAFGSPLRGALAARNPASHERMGVAGADAKRLRFVGDDGTLGTILVGRPGRGFRTVYARRDGADDVYQIAGPLVTIAERTVTEWRDKHIASVEPNAVQRVEVARGGRTFVLDRADEGWRVNGAPADSAAVARLLDRYREIVAQGNAFATDDEIAGADFVRPDRRLTLVGANDARLADLLFDSTEATYWVRRGDGETVYRLFAWRVDELTPADSTLRSREPR